MKFRKLFYIFLSTALFNTFLSNNCSVLLNLIPSFLFHHPPQLSDLKIKVLLKELPIPVVSQKFKISSNDGIRLQTSSNTRNPIVLEEKELLIELQGQEIYLSGHNLKKIKTKKQCRWISLSPIKNNIVVDNVPYEGTIKFLISDKNKLLLINTLNINDYVYSVLRYEIFQSWPMEIQKIQAVASRTYAFHQMSIARKKGRPYDIKNNNTHQIYNGTHEFKHLKEAVTSTKNMILTYDNKPAVTMFDSCCGGIIPANMSKPQFNEAPYLARKKRCTFCQDTPFYSWENEIKADEFLNRLKSNPKFKTRLQNFETLKEIKILEKDKAGIVHKVQLLDDKKAISCKGNEIRSLMGDKIYSLSFTVKKNLSNITITGNGYGHQLGLCQRGAHELVRQGWDLKKILDFYYPQTKLVLLTKIRFKN